MAEREHHGVVAIVTDPARTHFLVQQKDEHYAPFPDGYSLFGGAVEVDENDDNALIRELQEELGEIAARLLTRPPRRVLSMRPPPGTFQLTAYELIVPLDQLRTLHNCAVQEGRRGVVMSRSDLTQTELVWGLSAVVAAYLRQAE